MPLFDSFSRKILLLICLLFSGFVLTAQGDFCMQVTEFCPAENGGEVVFPAGTNVDDAEDTEPGNDYGCLFTSPNPAWYYIQIGQPGSLNIFLTNSNNLDIDFALWGPFPDLNVASDNCGSLPAPTDCSYSGSANETVSIPFSQSGQIYILLITNFSNSQTDIFGEASGDGVPACCTTPLNTGLECSDPAPFSCGCWTQGIFGVLPTDNPGTQPLDFCGDTENQQWISFESCWCGVEIEIEALDCPLDQGIEVQLFSECDPLTAASDCLTVAEDATSFLPAVDGGMTIECVPGETYTMLIDGINGDVCSYIITATEVPLDPPVFASGEITGPDSVCSGTTHTYFFPEVEGADFCDVTYSAPDATIIDFDHESVTIMFGETSGDLCIEAVNCSTSTEICKSITVFPSAPELSNSPPIKVCDDLAAFYTISFELANGSLPYVINGEVFDGINYTSVPIPAGEAYSFTITSENFCLDPLVVSGQEECPCETDAGSLVEVFAELCGDDVYQIEQQMPVVLDENDVSVYVLRNADGEVVDFNNDGSFTYQEAYNLNEIYTVCGYAGNDDGTGFPLTDYICFSETNCTDVVFYEGIQANVPDTLLLTCEFPESRISSVLFGGSGNYDIEWTTGGEIISNEQAIDVTEPGTYTVTVRDQLTSCVGVSVTEVLRAPFVSDISLTLIPPTCYQDRDGIILIDSVTGGTPPYRFRLDDGEFTGNTELILLTAGDYELMVIDANGCTFKTSANLIQPIQVTADLGDDLTGDTGISLGESALAEVQTSVLDSASVVWTINEEVQPDTLFFIDSIYRESVYLTATVFDKNGCFAVDTIYINVEQINPVFAPNAFSPNDDGNNDIWSLYGDSSVEIFNFVRVYDRWGNMVYESEEPFLPNDNSIGWDGRHRGQRAPTGIYVYALEVLYIDGRTERMTGDVLLVR